MEKSNTERIFIQIMKQISNELNFSLEFLSYNWIIRVRNKEIIRHIIGYDWELNSSTSQLIAKDKSACSELLKSQGIHSIEHKLFLNPQSQSYIDGKGNWLSLIKYSEMNKYPLVCKSNMGTGGNEVFKANSQVELESYVHMLFSKHRGICLSPFYNIKNEYRVILLFGEAYLVYVKQKPHVIGNGTSTVLELISHKYDRIAIADFELQNFDLKIILPIGEILELGWKHNLAKGAQAIIIEEVSLKERLVDFAISAAKAINITFAAIDIVEVEDNLLVMEINSGVMMENFALQSKKSFQIAKNIYYNALLKMMK